MSLPSESPWVVLPTYNERANIERMISTLFSLHIANLHVLVVDDSSPDGTAEAIRTLQAKYPQLHLVVRKKKEGLGQAYIHGFRTAREQGATAIIQMDADFSHNPSDVPRLLLALSTYDLVLGSRYVNGISVINWPLRRLILSVAANGYARVVTGMPFHDVTSGFKAWRTSTLRAIEFESVKADGYGFQIAMTHRVWKKHLRITEIPIIFTERREGQSKMNKSIIWEALWLVWRIRLFGS